MSLFKNELYKSQESKYLCVHSEIPVNSLGSIKESIAVIGEAAIHMATGIKVSTHGLSFPGSLDPGDSQAL